MSFENRGEAVVGAHLVSDLKTVYRVLHAHLGEHTELMDTDFLIELQTFLQRQAAAEGVDVSHHGEWDAWLGNADATPCEDRLPHRRVIDP